MLVSPYWRGKGVCLPVDGLFQRQVTVNGIVVAVVDGTVNHGLVAFYVIAYEYVVQTEIHSMAVV